MFLRTVFSSSTESKCMLQKLEGPIKWLGICQTPKKLRKFCETRISKKVINTENWNLANIQTLKNRTSIPVIS